MWQKTPWKCCSSTPDPSDLWPLVSDLWPLVSLRCRWAWGGAEEDLHKVGELSPVQSVLQDHRPLHGPEGRTHAHQAAGGPVRGEAGTNTHRVHTQYTHSTHTVHTEYQGGTFLGFSFTNSRTPEKYSFLTKIKAKVLFHTKMNSVSVHCLYIILSDCCYWCREHKSV